MPFTFKVAVAVTTLDGVLPEVALVNCAVMLVVPCVSAVTAPVAALMVATAVLLEAHTTELVRFCCSPVIPLVPMAAKNVVGTPDEVNGNVTVCVPGIMTSDVISFGDVPVTVKVAEAVTAL
jgi:hypothetical protein